LHVLRDGDAAACKKTIAIGIELRMSVVLRLSGLRILRRAPFGWGSLTGFRLFLCLGALAETVEEIE
jgi:hypothetical protein